MNVNQSTNKESAFDTFTASLKQSTAQDVGEDVSILLCDLSLKGNMIRIHNLELIKCTLLDNAKFVFLLLVPIVLHVSNTNLFLSTAVPKQYSTTIIIYFLKL